MGCAPVRVPASWHECRQGEFLPRVSPDLRFLAGPIRRSRARHPWYPLGSSLRMEGFIDLGIVDYLSTGSGETPFGDGAIAHNLRQCVQIKAASNLAMAHHFTGAVTDCAEGRFRALTGFADAFAVVAGAVNF